MHVVRDILVHYNPSLRLGLEGPRRESRGPRPVLKKFRPNQLGLLHKVWSIGFGHWVPNLGFKGVDLVLKRLLTGYWVLSLGAKVLH